MLQSIKTLLDSLDTRKIVYCHWKSNEHLQAALNGDTDLDVLFLPEQRSLIDATLNEIGLKRFRATPLMQYNAIEDYIGFDRNEGKIWHLHTHYRMTLGEKHLKGYTITPWTDIILEKRRFDENGIWCSSVEVELVLLVVRMTMKLRLRDFGKAIGKDDLLEMAWLMERKDDVKLREIACQLVNKGTADVILDLLRTSIKNKNQLKKLHRILLKEFRCFTSNTPLQSRIVRTKRELYWLVGGIKRKLGQTTHIPYRRISPSGGLAVSILGCDGAGKSTTIGYIKKEFSKKIDVAEFYFGSGDGKCSLLRRPLRFLVKKYAHNDIVRENLDTKDSSSGKSLKKRFIDIFKILWALSLALEKRKTLKKMTKARNNGMLVLTDRYPQTLIPGCNDGPLLSGYSASGWPMRQLSLWELSIYQKAGVNKPDLSIKLTVPTDIALARKPGMTSQVIDRKKEIVLSMDIARDDVIIDTSHPFQETRSQVMWEIWKRI